MEQKHYKKLIENFINFIGDDANREDLQKTPEKVLDSIEYCFSGYKTKDLSKLVSKLKIQERNNDIIALKNIQFQSFCQHHILPIIGKISIGYIPDEYIISIGSIIKIVDTVTKRLQLQERICYQIANCMQNNINPLGCIILAEASHMCLMCKASGVQFLTIHKTGIFLEDEDKCQSFLSLVK